jgi:predicted thioesterase
MSDEIRLGLSAEKSIEVTRELTIAVLSDKLPAVYSTPAMIWLMETTSGEAIQPHLPPSHISVGVEVNIRHLAATPIGERVTATAKVIEVVKNLVKFEVEARDEKQLIGSGTHTRAVVELERFRRGLNQSK